MATFEESFLYLLILLLIGAGVSGALITWFTHWLENRRKERVIEVERKRKEWEIKVELMSKMAEAAGYIHSTAVALVEQGVNKIPYTETDSLIEDRKKWYADGEIINSKLESYSPIQGSKIDGGNIILF